MTRIAALTGLLFLTGCATTAPSARFTQSLAPSSHVTAGDETKITVTSVGEVSMLDYEKSRVAQRIQEKLDKRKLLNSSTGANVYEIEVLMTRYDKGSAFARAMLAGLGQIHIQATVRMFTSPARVQVGEFQIKKAFAWGGLYGGSTTIEGVELGFADGVAAALTGQKDEAPKNSRADPATTAAPTMGDPGH